MTYRIVRESPSNSKRTLPNLEFDTLREAREYLRTVLDAYKADYRRKHKVREHCYWYDTKSIVVHKINDDGYPGDRVTYNIYKHWTN